MSEKTTQTPFYICPNDCEGAYFHRYGTVTAAQLLTETGEEMELDTDDFTPSKGVDGEIKCRKCDTLAIIKTKIVTVTEEIV